MEKEIVAAIMAATSDVDMMSNDRMEALTKESWQRIIEIYGISKAEGILGAIRTIMIGNAYDIPWSSFFNRFGSKPDPRSSLTYETSMILSTILIPISFIHTILSNLFKVPIISF